MGRLERLEESRLWLDQRVFTYNDNNAAGTGIHVFGFGFGSGSGLWQHAEHSHTRRDGGGSSGGSEQLCGATEP